MSIPPEDQERIDQVMAAALELIDGGFGPLPLPPGQKAPRSDQPDWLKRLSGLTGKYPKMLTADEVRAHPEWWTGNLGMRLPPPLIGLDIDDHKGRGRDGLLPSERLARLFPGLYEALKAAPRSTSRGPDGWGGIYLFQLHEGVDYRTLRDPCEGVEVIRHNWRYLVVWPSIVDEREYAQPEGAACPLPAGLLQALTRPQQSQNSNPQPEGEGSPEDPPDAPDDWDPPAQSRHDWLVSFAADQARKKGMSVSLLISKMRSKNAYKSLADDPNRTAGLAAEVRSIAEWAMTNCAKKTSTPGGGAEYKWDPLAYAQQVRQDLLVETDPWGRLYIYLEHRGYYEHDQAVPTVRRHVRRLIVDRPDHLPPVPHGIHRAEYEREVVYLLSALAPKLTSEDTPLLAVANCALDLTIPDKPKIVEHSPDHYLTTGLAVEYNKKAQGPTWLRLLNHTLPNPEDRRFIRQIVGAALSNIAPPKGGGLLDGEKNSGKSTLLRIITALFHPHVSGVTPHEMAGRFAAAELFGSKINIVPDLPTRPLADTGEFKKATGGGDTTSGEIKGVQKRVRFVNQAPFLMATNAIPSPKYDTSGAIFARLSVMRCPNELAHDDINPLLEQTVIAEELPYVLLWAMEGLKDIHDQNWNYTVPAYAQEKAERLFYDANHYLDFFAEHIRTQAGGHVTTADVGRAYNKWVKGQPVTKLTAQVLYEHLDHWLDCPRRTKVKGYWGWPNAMLLEPETLQ